MRRVLNTSVLRERECGPCCPTCNEQLSGEETDFSFSGGGALKARYSLLQLTIPEGGISWGCRSALSREEGELAALTSSFFSCEPSGAHSTDWPAAWQARGERFKRGFFHKQCRHRPAHPLGACHRGCFGCQLLYRPCAVPGQAAASPSSLPAPGLSRFPLSSALGNPLPLNCQALPAHGSYPARTALRKRRH